MLRLLAQSQMPLRGMRRPRSLMGGVTLQLPFLASHSTTAPTKHPLPPLGIISDTEEDLTQTITHRKPRGAASSTTPTSSTSMPLDASSAPSAGGAGPGSAGAGGGGGGEPSDTPSALYTISQYHRDRRMVSDFTRKHRRLKSQSIDSSALSYTRVSTTSALSMEAGLNLAVGGDSMGGPASSRASEPGIAVDYCIFCYHGLSHLRHDNTTLLSKFVSERGAILPKRFTKCCAKHQKVVAATLKRARSLALIPFHAKLHPQARFPSFSPPHPTTRGTLSHLQATQLNAAASESSLGGKGGGLGVAKQMLIEELSK